MTNRTRIDETRQRGITCVVCLDSTLGQSYTSLSDGHAQHLSCCPITPSVMPSLQGLMDRKEAELRARNHWMAKNPAAVALGKLGGAKSSPAKTAANKENGKKGGWPKGKPRKPRP